MDTLSKMPREKEKKNFISRDHEEDQLRQTMAKEMFQMFHRVSPRLLKKGAKTGRKGGGVETSK